MAERLIYDLGLHDGGDTAQYLREGARVVAVDANPVMCAAAEKRFAAEIAAGQLIIVNRGIAAERGRVEFWICDDISEWSSFDRDMAGRDGARHHAIDIDCIPIGDLIAAHGVPDYAKIDIEGADQACIDGLTVETAPRHISIELGHTIGDAQLARLAELGYRDFKLICQNFLWRQITPRSAWFYELGPRHPLTRPLRKLAAVAIVPLMGRRLGQSGPWGERTAGAWHDLQRTLAMWRRLRDLDARLPPRSLRWWWDVHARKRPAPR